MRLQINKQGFYPIIKPLDEDITIDRLSNSLFRINMPEYCSATLYIDGVELLNTNETFIDLSDIAADILANKTLELYIIKKIFGYTSKPLIKKLKLELLACSEDDETLLLCSDTLLCS